MVAVANALGARSSRRRAAAAHRRHGRGAHGRGRRAGDPRRPRLARPGASRASPCARASAASPPRRRARSCSRRRTPIAASARPRRSATTGAAGRFRAPMPSDATRPASRTSSASACRRAEVVVEDATRGPVRFAGDEISDFVLVRADGRPTFDLATLRRRPRPRDHAHRARRGSPRELGASPAPAARARARSSRSSRTARSSSAPTASGSRRAAAPSRSRRCVRAACRPRPWSPTRRSSPARRRAAPARSRRSRSSPQRFSLARLGRGTAHADPAHLAWLGREVLAAFRSTSSRGAWRRSCRRTRRSRRARRARRGGAWRLGARRGRKLCCGVGTAPRRTAAGLARRWSSSASCARPTRASTCPTPAAVELVDRAARARREPRPLGPRRATPSENRPHGRTARPAAPGRGRSAAA